MKQHGLIGKPTAAPLRLLLSIGTLITFAAASHADTIVGIFSDPVVTGNLVGLNGGLVPYDNTTSAFYSIVNSTAIAPLGSNQQSIGSKIDWGSPGFSSLIFFGKTVPSDPYQTFDLGTLAYNNGTSDLNSLIFGAKITFYATPDGSLNSNQANGVSQIGIVTTSNLGTAGSEQHDADFVTLSGAANQSFNVLENAGATAELFGKFVDDPTILVTGIVLNPNQGGAGFIGTGNAIPVPETSSLLAGLGVLGLIGFEWLQRRRRAEAV